MELGRRLAFDYGSVRIGVAISDPQGIIATPLENLQSQSADLINQVSDLIGDYAPIYIAIGNPKHLSGNVSANQESVRDFIGVLKSVTQLPIYLIDERLTTVSAGKRLRENGKNARQAREIIDGEAAVAILESALAREKLQGRPSTDLV